MGRIFVIELEGKTYKCKFCKTQLALADDLVSRAFHCRRGKAYLFHNAKQLMKKARNTKKANLSSKEAGSLMDWTQSSTMKRVP